MSLTPDKSCDKPCQCAQHPGTSHSCGKSCQCAQHPGKSHSCGKSCQRAQHPGKSHSCGKSCQCARGVRDMFLEDAQGGNQAVRCQKMSPTPWQGAGDNCREISPILCQGATVAAEAASTSCTISGFACHTPRPMDKSFESGPIESKWYDYWERHGCFKPTGDGDPYCILLPPPNVTGTLHMGHAFQQTVMDMLIRYQRMRVKNTLWQVGSDHAGIATQKIVENQLAAEDTDKHALGRDAFIERVWQWKGESGSTITDRKSVV